MSTSGEPHPSTQLDTTVHQPTRLGILTVLSEAERADFTYLQESLELTSGNLSRHLRVLEEAGYVDIDKTFEDRRPRTWLSITAAGAAALHAEITELRSLIDDLPSPEPS